MEMAAMLLGLTAAQPGTGRECSQAPQGSAAGEPPLARSLKKKKPKPKNPPNQQQ